MRADLRHLTRRIVYGVPLLRRIGEKFASPTDAAYWDGALSTWAKPYMGGTISIDWRNALISTLVKHHAGPNPAVLDVGCAGGTLACALPSFSRYLGTDISAVAVKQAAEAIHGDNIAFQACDMRDFEIKPEWDVIVFAELLYFLAVDDAVATVARYTKGLKPGGIIIISMKDEGGKSIAIHKALAERFEWIDGLVWQAKTVRPEYRLSVNRERPPFLIGALR